MILVKCCSEQWCMRIMIEIIDLIADLEKVV
jgi:hypothetical protein